MIGIKTRFIAVFLLSAIATGVYGANPVEYSISDLGLLTGPASHPKAMNALGQVVGSADTYTRYTHAFLYTGSAPLVNIGSFGGDYSVSVATGINNSGMVVGYSDEGGSNPTVAFLYTQSGGMQTLGPALDSALSYAWGLNNNGQIVGFYETSSGSVDGFLYSSANGSMLDLGPYLPYCINDAGLVAATGGSGTTTSTYISSGGTGAWTNIGSLGGTYTVPDGMNSLGAIVGASSTIAGNKNWQQPFLYSGGTMTDLGTFGGQEGGAYAINDYGVVVGSADLPGDMTGHGFVYYGGGAIEDLNELVDPSLGWTILGAVAINDSGQIAAEAYQQGGYDHAILLTPTETPEPSTLSLLIVAVFAFLTIKAKAALNWIRRYAQVI